MSRRFALVAAAGFITALPGIVFAPSTARAAAPPPATFTANVRADRGMDAAHDPGENEPAVGVDQAGTAYVTWQKAQLVTSPIVRTTDGATFTTPVFPDPVQGTTGDVAFANGSYATVGKDVPITQAGSNGMYYAQLGLGNCGAIQTRVAYSEDQGSSWHPADATCQPGQVDRPWLAAYTPAQYRGTAQAAAHTMLYTESHDFGTSNIWVNSSADGGHTWNVIPMNAEQPGSAAQLTSLCNSIPGGIAVDQRGAHAGRVYAIWETSDPVFYNAEGCNITQAQPFDHLFVSYSDDSGITWTSEQVYNDPCASSPPLPPTFTVTANPAFLVSNCQDNSELFNSVAVDDAGNVYAAFVRRAAPSRGAAPEYDVYVSVSRDGGVHWNGSTTAAAGPPLLVSKGAGTHYMPWVVAGQDGAIDIVYYATSQVAQPSSYNNKPQQTDTNARWDVYMAQSMDHGQTFTESRVSDAPQGVYFGDICSTGIFCGGAPPGSNWGPDRTLYDVFGASVGPDGALRTAWTDARDTFTASCHPGVATQACEGGPGASTHVYFACQKTGMTLYGQLLTGTCPHGTLTNFPATVLASPSPSARSVLPNTARAPAAGVRGGAGIGILAALALAVLLPAVGVRFAGRRARRGQGGSRPG